MWETDATTLTLYALGDVILADTLWKRLCFVSITTLGLLNTHHTPFGFRRWSEGGTNQLVVWSQPVGIEVVHPSAELSAAGSTG